MASFVYTVFTEPVPGQEAEYNRWYTEQHIDDVLRVPGFKAVKRYRLAVPDAQAPAGYLAIYEIETDDVQATLAQLNSRAGSAEMPISPALDISRVKALVYGAIEGAQRP